MDRDTLNFFWGVPSGAWLNRGHPRPCRRGRRTMSMSMRSTPVTGIITSLLIRRF